MMKLFCLILCKCRKLRLHLVNSILILFEEKIHLTHLHGLILKGGQPFWVPQPDSCPCKWLQNYVFAINVLATMAPLLLYLHTLMYWKYSSILHVAFWKEKSANTTREVPVDNSISQMLTMCY
jgi:hypothetical protein